MTKKQKAKVLLDKQVLTESLGVMTANFSKRAKKLAEEHGVIIDVKVLIVEEDSPKSGE